MDIVSIIIAPVYVPAKAQQWNNSLYDLLDILLDNVPLAISRLGNAYFSAAMQRIHTAVAQLRD